MSKYRGSQGSVSVGGNTVAQVKEWEFTPARPYIESTHMGDSGKKGDLDLPGGTGRMRVTFDYGDAAQAAMLDQVISNAAPTPLAFLGIVETGGPKQISCNILITSAPITGRVLGGHFEATFNFESDGTISVSWT